MKGHWKRFWVVKVKFEPRDLWVGLFWKVWRDKEDHQDVYDFYICPLPTLLIHIHNDYRWVKDAG